MSRIIVITGAMAAGKSTVVQRLAERLTRAVHLRGDIFRRMIASGREELTPSPTTEAVAQLQLRYDLGTIVAARYHDAGFDVVYQDIVFSDDLRQVIQLLRDRVVDVNVLSPSPGVVAERDAARGKTGYGDAWTPEMLDRQLCESTGEIGFWLDTSELTVDETVDRKLEHVRQ